MITLNELIVFAIVLVALQMISGLVMTVIAMKAFTSKKFIKKYSRMAAEVTMEMLDEMD